MGTKSMPERCQQDENGIAADLVSPEPRAILNETTNIDDELRSITGHLDRDVVARYALPSEASAANAVAKRLRGRAQARKLERIRSELGKVRHFHLFSMCWGVAKW
jgi:hypothetical protein